MSQVTFVIQMDEDLKKQLDNLCYEFGMTTDTAFNIFARTVVRERKIPFEITATDNYYTKSRALEVMKELCKEAAQNGAADMTLDDINAEIDKTRR